MVVALPNRRRVPHETRPPRSIKRRAISQAFEKPSSSSSSSSSIPPSRRPRKSGGDEIGSRQVQPTRAYPRDTHIDAHDPAGSDLYLHEIYRSRGGHVFAEDYRVFIDPRGERTKLEMYRSRDTVHSFSSRPTIPTNINNRRHSRVESSR